MSVRQLPLATVSVVLATLAMSVDEALAVEIGHTTASLSQSRYGVVGTSVGELALFAGGEWAPTSRVDMYDATAPAGQQWTTAELSQARTVAGATSAGGKAIIAGGQVAGGGSPNQWTSRVDMYDANASRWSTAELSRAVFGPAATSVAGIALIAGGFVQANGNDYVGSSVVDVYNPTSNNWSTMSLSQGRGNLSAVTIGDKAYFAGGGWSEGGTWHNSDRIDVYDAAGDSWSQMTMPENRRSSRAGACGDKLFVAGGRNADGTMSDRIDVFDTGTGAWSGAQLSVARESVVFGTVDGFLFIAGGWTGPGNYAVTDVVDVFDSHTNTWSVLHRNSNAPYPAVAVVGDAVIFAGGGYPPSNAVDIFTVPEPVTLSFLALGWVAALRRRKA